MSVGSGHGDRGKAGWDLQALASFEFSALLLTCCVTSGKLLNLPGQVFIPIRDGCGGLYLRGLF